MFINIFLKKFPKTIFSYIWLTTGRTFCSEGLFVVKDVLWEGRFVEEDLSYRRTFCMGGRFVEGRFVEGCLVEGRLVGRTFCRKEVL